MAQLAHNWIKMSDMSDICPINSVSKATVTRDSTELFNDYKLIEKKGETGIGTYYELKGFKKGS